MRVVIATSTGFHLRHLAREFSSLGIELEFHSYLPHWKTREYGIPRKATRSHFAPLFPNSALAVARHIGGVEGIRERLFAKIDERVAVSMTRPDVFIGLSGITVKSAIRARELGALVLIERGGSHIANQIAILQQCGAMLPGSGFIQRELDSYSAANKVIVLSQFAKNTFIEQGFPASSLEMQILGTDLQSFHPDLHSPGQPVRVLFVGAWSLRKGADHIARLSSERPDIIVTHIGANGEVPECSSVRHLGHMNVRRLSLEMRKHDVLILPSREDGFGMVMTEALASGLRVVASDATGGPDLLGIFGSPYVSVFPSGDYVEFASALDAQICELLADPERRVAPRSLIEKISWKGYARRYLDMIDRLRGGAA